jgi:hypothetical protein
MFRSIGTILLSALLPAAVLSWNPSVAVEPAEVVVKTLADAPQHGNLRAFSLTDGLTLETDGDPALITIPPDEIVQIVVTHERTPAGPRPAGRTPPPRPPVEVQLAGGDRLFGQPVHSDDYAAQSGNDEAVLLATTALGTLAIPLAGIDAWINSAPGTPRPALDPPSSAGGPWSSEDRLLLTNGDVLHGLLLAIDDRHVTFEAEGSAMTVPHSQVVAVDLVAEAPRWSGALRATVMFQDGSRLTTDELTGTGDELALTLFGRVPRTVPWDRIARLDLAGGRWVWLSALEPISVQDTPMLSLSWPYVKDANVLGGPMRLAHRGFDHGLGVHSECSLRYDLAGAYAWFVTYLGVDDSAGPLADVTAEIQVNGQVRYRQEHIRVGQLCGPVRIDVRGAATLELRVLFGDHAAVQDRFNWADAGLIRVGTSERPDARALPSD